MKKSLLLFATVIFTVFILLLSLRGNLGNVNEGNINSNKWMEEGPFELSPERGRFALTYSLINDHSFGFSMPIARFATPDLGYIKGKFVSLFPPGVSYIAMPGFIIGSLIGLNQVGSFAIIALFAVFNVVLIYLIAVRLGLNRFASALASLTYVFATPAFAYSVTLYQHQISAFLILASIYILVRWKNLWSLAAIWFMAALSIPIDYPNLVLMFPIGLVALARIVNFEKVRDSISVNVKLLGLATFAMVVLPILFFLYFNQMSYGNPLQFSGTIRRITAMDQNGNILNVDNLSSSTQQIQAQDSASKKTAIGFFQTRNMLNGLNIHLFSLDRGVLVFTPVVLFGLLGIYFEDKRKNPYLPLLVSVAAVDLILYSMWGDPWGGWAFGSRYLIPAYAVLAILIAGFLTRFRRNLILLSVFFLVLVYSVFVNTLGALTSNANPPKGEAIALAQTSGLNQKYTYFRDYDYLRFGNSKSFVFRTYASNYLTAYQYYIFIASSIVIFGAFLAFLLYRSKEGN